MKVHHNTDSLPMIKGAVVTIGTFDGVHLGHRQIIRQIKSTARQIGGSSVLVTFDPHPRMVLQPQAEIRMLTTLSEKAELLEELGIDHLIVIPFSRRFSEMPANEYVNDFLIGKLQASVIVIGYDHRFGKNRKGDIGLLRELIGHKGVEIQEIPARTIDHSAVSSTLIRKSLLDGQVQKAAQLLGRFYSIQGIVVKGEQIGRQLGYPTANLQLNSNSKLVPKDGVYTVQVVYQDAVLGGMLSIGKRPTFDGTSKTIEVHIFSFDKEIYGEKLELRFVRFLRSEVRFETRTELIRAMENDEIDSLKILSEIE